MTIVLDNVHPGEVLLEEFLTPFGISQNRLARDIGVPPRRINEIIHGNQADYDLEEARKRLGDQLDRDIRPRLA